MKRHKKSKRVRKHVRTAGTGCIWPRGVELRYDISPPTRWRWERDGRLPRRDVFIGGRPVGWKPSTIEGAEQAAPAA